MNPYSELGVSSAASLEELKKAYRRAVLKYHPDSASGLGNPEKFNKVVQAYETLKRQKEKKFHTRRQNGPSSPGHAAKESNYFHVELDEVTAQMPVDQLIRFLDNTDNPHVRMIAIKALAMKKNALANSYLLNLLHHNDLETKCHIIRIMGEYKLHQVGSALFSWIAAKEPEVAFETVKSLELMNPANRIQIIKYLKDMDASFWSPILSPIRRIYQRIELGRRQMKALGGILLKNENISSEQLIIALMLQKKHQLLLGAVLTKLGYTSRAEIQHALLIQKG
ncbi:MAG: DnaJ domain-containing protein [SAR324 cluster bacterium]|nr:DnaJ domain-containing protein [SAR324 cluster bacterium]